MQMAAEDPTDGMWLSGGDGKLQTVGVERRLYGVERHYVIPDMGFLWEPGRLTAESLG